MAGVQVNGREVPFIIDNSIFYNSMAPDTAGGLGLRLDAPPPGTSLSGITELTSWRMATVKELRAGTFLLRNAVFVVRDAGGLNRLGQGFLGVAGDEEYDFGHGALRLWRSSDCGADAYAYWVKPGEGYAVLDFDEDAPAKWWTTAPHLRAEALLNGARIFVRFNTAAPVSLLSLRAAAGTGVRPGGPGVMAAGPAPGAAHEGAQTWIAPFARFRIGDEELHNVLLRIGEMPVGIDMLLGADFFRSHRIYKARGAHQMYFTFNGGSFVNVDTPPTQP